jgi:hypothetical protein
MAQAMFVWPGSGWGDEIIKLWFGRKATMGKVTESIPEY